MLDVGSRRVVLRDATLREGLDTPGVRFTADQAMRIAGLLAACGVPELELVAPSRVRDDLELVRRLSAADVALRSSGLIYASAPSCAREIEAASACLDRFDLLMPLSSERAPRERPAKVETLVRALEQARNAPPRAGTGAGLPHATQIDAAFVVEIARAAARAGAERITLYDTNGSGDPFRVRELIGQVRDALPPTVALFFHGHNDLGLATANSLAAVLGGASGLDVTVNGLGDRAGNASLEQVVMGLAVRGIETGADPRQLTTLSRTVAELSGVPLSKLAPVVGEFVFAHRSPGHFGALTEFEAFAPELVGAERRTA